MAKPLVHAGSSARRYGGDPSDYLPLHQTMDRSKGAGGSNLHRALTHHAEFLWILEEIHGVTLLAGGRAVSTRACGEQHCREDHGNVIPTAADYWRALARQAWMVAGAGTETIARHTTATVAALGGSPADHQRVHGLLEYGRPSLPVGTHRGLTHHAFGVWLIEQAAGETLGGIPVREICRLHIEADLGRDVPDAGEWLERLTFSDWMNGGSAATPPSVAPLLRYRAAGRARFHQAPHDKTAATAAFTTD